MLVGLLLLGALLSPWTRVPAAQEPTPPTPTAVLLTEKARRAIITGALSQARQHLEEALAHEPHYAPALLFQACLALEAGDSPKAELLLGRLQAVTPEGLELQLLQRLVAHHTHAPTAGWRRNFLRAWTELGRPSFTESSLLPELDLGELDIIPEDAWKRAASVPARLTVVLSLPKLSEEQARWLISQLPMLENAALVQAAAVTLLTENLPHSLRAEARLVVRRRLAQVAEASPSAMLPRVLLLWAEAPDWETFNQRELEALEAIAALPRWRETSLTQTFLEARVALMEAGVAHPGVSALWLARMSNNTWGVILLAKRAEVTRSQLLPGSRQRLGRILWNIGSRLREDSTVLVSNVGLQLMERGARDIGDEEESKRAANAWEQASDELDAAESAALERWPLPSLWEEVAEARARDEWAHVREFAGLP
jgi:hypothetical protein